MDASLGGTQALVVTTLLGVRFRPPTRSVTQETYWLMGQGKGTDSIRHGDDHRPAELGSFAPDVS